MTTTTVSKSKANKTTRKTPRRVSIIDAGIDRLKSLTPQARADELIKSHIEVMRISPWSKAKGEMMADATRDAIELKPYTCHYMRSLTEQDAAWVANSREMLKLLADRIHPNDAIALCEAMLSLLVNPPSPYFLQDGVR